MAIIKFKLNELIFTKSFLGPLFVTFCPAKLNACGTVCAYIVTNIVTKLQQLDNVTLQLDDGSDDDQLGDKDSNLEDDISGPEEIDRIPKGGPSAINDGSSDNDKEIPEAYYSGSDQENTTPSTLKNKNQLWKKIIPWTDKLFPESVEKSQKC